MTTKMVTIRLTEDEARHVFMNADGWLDAGACKDGLEPDEQAALNKLCDQINRKLRGNMWISTKPRRTTAVTSNARKDAT